MVQECSILFLSVKLFDKEIEIPDHRQGKAANVFYERD